MNITYRPISTWPGDRAAARRSSPFDSSWSSTMETLRRELEKLGAHDVVLELGLADHHIRADGLPRANAPQPADPGVIISFESNHGPMRYATDVFTKWHANVRAIALGLEALRKVDRYGITKRGEQYAGWRQIEAASQSADDARLFLAETIDERISEDVDTGDLDDEGLVRLARRVSHPDAQTGDHETFLAVQHAAETLGVA